MSRSNLIVSSGLKHPYLELAGNYWQKFRTSWKQRHVLEGPKRSVDEIAFLPAALSLQDTPVHPAPRILAWAIILLFLIALFWSFFGKVDIVAIAPGRIVVTHRTKVVQPLERSVVRRIMVRDGDFVKSGQPLVELDSTLAKADAESNNEQLRIINSEKIRTRVIYSLLGDGNHLNKKEIEINFDKIIKELSESGQLNSWSSNNSQTVLSQLVSESSEINAKLTRYSAEVDRRKAEIYTLREMVKKLETTLPIAQQREKDFAKLAEQGFMSFHAMQDRAKERIEIERDLSTSLARLFEGQANLKESEQSRLSYIADTKKNLVERQVAANHKSQQIFQEQNKTALRERLAILNAPVTGTVQQLAAHTEGGVVTEAQTLMVIVPEEANLTIEATLDNKDIGFVNISQNAEIKLETFPFTRYGTLRAVVKSLTADAVEDEKRGAVFPMTLLLEKTTIDIDGKVIRLTPGMNVTAEIKTGQRRIIEFIMSPIQKSASESLRER